MKLLLLLINVVLLSFLPSTCHHQQKKADDSVKVDSTSIGQSPTVSDSMSTDVEETKATYSGNNLDTLSREDKYSNGTGQKHEAPKHDSPEQMKIDSIKAAKAKKKKG